MSACYISSSCEAEMLLRLTHEDGQASSSPKERATSTLAMSSTESSVGN